MVTSVPGQEPRRRQEAARRVAMQRRDESERPVSWRKSRLGQGAFGTKQVRKETSGCLRIYLSKSIYLPIYLPIYQSVFLSFDLSIDPSIYPSIYPSLFVYFFKAAIRPSNIFLVPGSKVVQLVASGRDFIQSCSGLWRVCSAGKRRRARLVAETVSIGSVRRLPGFAATPFAPAADVVFAIIRCSRAIRHCLVPFF